MSALLEQGGAMATWQALLALAPHLSTARRKWLGADKNRAFFGPALSVAGRCRRYCFNKGQRCDTIYLDNVWPLTAARGVQSAETIEEMQEAIAYAEERWPERLNEPIWNGVLEGVLLRHTGTISPSRFWLALRYSMDSLLLGPFGEWQPMGAELDMNSVFVTTEPTLAMELMGTALPHLAYFCGYCGNGMQTGVCNVCRNDYSQRWKPNNPSTDFPLPCVAVHELQSRGHVFATDPVEARKAHYRKWANMGHEPTARPKRERSIEL